MSGFSIDWLDLREPVDRRSRDQHLLEQARQWLASVAGSQSPATVVDLGAGTGATLRAFAASKNSAPLQWRLVDHDATLLAEATRRHGDANRLATFARNLADTVSLPLEGAQLITASALFDLVSAEFVKNLADSMARHSQSQAPGFYSALNYDGTTLWFPVHPLDATVLAAFNRDQQRDKGFGPALGPDSGAFLEEEFKRRGYRVSTASSPWQLDGNDQALVQALIRGIADAVREDASLQQADLEDWQQFRLDESATGSGIVGHLDILALPGNEQARV